MKLITFAPISTNKPTPGVLLPVQGSATRHEIVDLSGLGHSTILSLIEGGPVALSAARAAIATAPRIPQSDVTLLAPMPRPTRIFAIGLNYQSHAAESKMAVQKVPTVFMKLTSAVIGPEESIVLPAASSEPDYEAELAVVISQPGYQIPATKAMEYVLGYTILNDVSARDIQLSTSQWTLGKSFPTFDMVCASFLY
jgi:2-keto-4-pentenoate hydratase/2-oxohepta-3-ene-1,7-dioic acid hydratase in catechol pathway